VLARTVAGVFDTSLSAEYRHVAAAYGLDAAALGALAAAGFDATFGLSADTIAAAKRAIAEAVREETARCDAAAAGGAAAAASPRA